MYKEELPEHQATLLYNRFDLIITNSTGNDKRKLLICRFKVDEKRKTILSHLLCSRCD